MRRQDLCFDLGILHVSGVIRFIEADFGPPNVADDLHGDLFVSIQVGSHTHLATILALENDIYRVYIHSM